MILRRIVGRSMAEALARVEREVGKDALIVETGFEGGLATVIARRREEELPPSAAPTPRREPSVRDYQGGYRPIAERLQDFGLGPRLIDVLYRAVRGLHPHLLHEGDPSLPRIVLRVLAGLLPVARHPQQAPRALALVGPTGVGKTTTLAKLAAHALIHEKRDIAIVSLDTFRIAAVEQLRAFAEMMDAPFEVVFTPQDLTDALKRFAHKDRIFVDTTGRSPRDAASLTTMQGYFRKHPEIEVQLCLPAGSRRRDLEATLTAFRGFRPRGLVLTKWDETLAPGEALGLAIEREIPVSHITTGQRVPEDLVRADAGRLAEAALLGTELETRYLEAAR